MLDLYEVPELYHNIISTNVLPLQGQLQYQGSLIFDTTPNKAIV
jgi:hypothetical protein